MSNEGLRACDLTIANMTDGPLTIGADTAVTGHWTSEAKEGDTIARLAIINWGVYSTQSGEDATASVTISGDGLDDDLVLTWGVNADDVPQDPKLVSTEHRIKLTFQGPVEASGPGTHWYLAELQEDR